MHTFTHIYIHTYTHSVQDKAPRRTSIDSTVSVLQPFACAGPWWPVSFMYLPACQWAYRGDLGRQWPGLHFWQYLDPTIGVPSVQRARAIARRDAETALLGWGVSSSLYLPSPDQVLVPAPFLPLPLPLLFSYAPTIPSHHYLPTPPRPLPTITTTTTCLLPATSHASTASGCFSFLYFSLVPSLPLLLSRIWPSGSVIFLPLCAESTALPAASRRV